MLDQKFKDFELILVDDGSNDGSLEVCKVYEKKYGFIKVISHEKNKGLSFTRQTGLENASGKYIIFVDSDDFVNEDFLAILYDKAKSTDADIICSDIFYAYKDWNKYVTCKYNTDQKSIIRAILNNSIGSCGQVTRLVKKSLITENGIYFEPGVNMFEDRVFAVKLFFYAKKIEYTHHALYYYVQYNSESITKAFTDEKQKEMFLALSKIEDFLKEKTGDEFSESILDFKCYINFLIWLHSAPDFKKRTNFFPEATSHILKSKSIPRFHTRIILYLHTKNHIWLSRFLFNSVKIAKKIANKEDYSTKLNKCQEIRLNHHNLNEKKNYDVSVIIVNYNTRDLLKNCLSSLFNETKDILFEVLVSDNGSKDGSLEMVCSDFPTVKIIENKANLGFGAGNNRALEKAEGKYIFYLNSDTVVLNNAVKIFFDYFENHKDENIGALGSNLLDENNKIIHSAGFFRSINTELKDAIHDMLRSYKLIVPILKNKKLGRTPAGDKEIFGEVDYVTGADLFVKNDEYAEFDERYFLYYEETDMQKQMDMAGKNRLVIAGPKIQHLKGGSIPTSSALKFYASVSKINTFLSCCKFQKKFYKNPIRLFLLKLIITIHWLNPALVGKTGSQIKNLWKI